MFERAGKIKKWLEERNYKVEYAGTNTYRYTDNFHSGDYYAMDSYRVSNGYEIMVKIEGQARFWLIDKSHNHVGVDFSQEHFIKQFDKVFPYRVKSLDEIKGFDDVGIGVIWLEEGKGAYILCRDLKGHDLEGVQIYRYSMYRMYKVDNAEEDGDGRVYCVRRKDIEEKEKLI